MWPSGSRNPGGIEAGSARLVSDEQGRESHSGSSCSSPAGKCRSLKPLCSQSRLWLSGFGPAGQESLADSATTVDEIAAAAGGRSGVFAGIIVDWRRADFIIARANQNNRLGQRA